MPTATSSDAAKEQPIQLRRPRIRDRRYGNTSSTDRQAAEEQAWALGKHVRTLLQEKKGLTSVAAPGFQSPGVVVVHTDDKAITNKFIQAGTQIAAGVPFMLGEPSETKTFRIGLFGLDKLKDPAQTCANLEKALNVAMPGTAEAVAA